MIKERAGEIFYIQVAGPVTQSGKLVSWTSPFWQTPPITATLRLEDSGNLHYASDIQVVVSDVFGNPKYTLTTEKELLPHTIRKIVLSWPETPGLGLFKVSGTASVLGKTETLPTHYVLVVSRTVREVSLIILVVIIVLAVMLFSFRRGRQFKRPHAR